LRAGEGDFFFQLGQRGQAADVAAGGEQHAAGARCNQLEVRAELRRRGVQQDDVIAGFQAGQQRAEGRARQQFGRVGRPSRRAAGQV
jgi:hypothetical protein